MPKLPIGDMGPCEIVWNYGETAALYLGEYLGQVKLTMDTKVNDIQQESDGDAAVDGIYAGSTMTLEIPLTRSTLDELAIALNSGAPVPSGSLEYLEIKNQIGCDLYSLAKSIVIKPICGDVVSTDPSEWIQLFKCYPIPGMDLVFDRATQRIFPTKFKVFVDQDSPYTGLFGTLGMPSGSTEYGI